MAIVNCPSCGKKTSDMMRVCPKCGAPYEPPEGSDALERSTRKKARDRSYRAIVHVYLGVLITTAGVVWMWFSSDQMTHPASFGAQATLGLGVVWYLAARVYGVWSRK